MSGVLFIISPAFVANAQQLKQHFELSWHYFSNYRINNVEHQHVSTFDGAFYDQRGYGALPVFSKGFDVKGDQQIRVSTTNENYEIIKNAGELQDAALVKKKEVGELRHHIGYERGNSKVVVQFVPIRYNAGAGLYERLVSFDIVIDYAYAPAGRSAFFKKPNISQSVLASGTWFRLGVTNTGMQKVTGTFLKAQGIDMKSVDPATIRIYGNGAGMLPQLNSVARPDDLKENPIEVIGQADGKFDDDDAIVFFGESQAGKWIYDKASDAYVHQSNIYSDTTYYFLTFGGAAGKRIQKQSPPPAPNVPAVQEFDYNYVHEADRKNLIKSGRLWVGEEFDKEVIQEFNVNMGFVNTAVPIRITSSAIARSFTPSSFSVAVNGSNVITHTIQSVSGSFEQPYALYDHVDPKSATQQVFSPIVNVRYTYNQTLSGSVGWLDYFELTSRNFLSMTGGQMSFRDSKSAGAGKVALFNIGNGSPALRVLDVTDPVQPREMLVTFSGGVNSFVAETDSVKEFFAFSGSEFSTPVFAGKVANQNLHGLGAADLVIVTHPDFIYEADRLASFHRARSGLRAHVVTTQQIYNEFSSGSQDVSAIRDFMRMLYVRAAVPQDKPRYLTLFGRASYDYKYRSAPNTNFVPTYESHESLDPVDSYNSDDYFGLLDDVEGRWGTFAGDYMAKVDFLDIGIGRLPAKDAGEAAVMVNKIISYTSPAALGDWRNRMVFVADDEDSDIHVIQAESLSNNAMNKFRNYNVEKIYIDVFNQTIEAGGQRYPDAKKAIVKAVERGALTINYTGHGGEVGLALERILDTDDIKSWTNGTRLPLFVTATCEFSRFDDPARTSAGEMVLLNPSGGGIGLFTTVRLVNSGSNFQLNTSFYKFAGLDSLAAFSRNSIGSIMMLTKNDYTSGDRNERNFTLLGDPALFLNYPQQRVVTTAINGRPVTSTPDTVKAFSKMTVQGMVTDIYGNPMTGFNGMVYPTVFDKARDDYQTQSNDGNVSPKMVFKMQTSVLFRGQATARNGVFSFSFVVPRDISQKDGFGKISYYADNGQTDAHGYNSSFVVGGTKDTMIADNIGPEIFMFMNDEKFVNGGLTNENPLFIAKLKDESGINVTGAVTRDLKLTLMQGAKALDYQSLNDYYRGNPDTYQEGEVRYQLKKLAQGPYTIEMEAYDVLNKSSEARLDFVVATSEEFALRHVLNYPNPFTTNTTFHFDHNKAGEPLDVMIQVYTVSGRLVKTLQMESSSATGHFDQLSWDGRDDYGDAIGKGVYVYKVKVRSASGKSAEEYQKLVILN